jgi:hypothetical protein
MIKIIEDFNKNPNNFSATFLINNLNLRVNFIINLAEVYLLQNKYDNLNFIYSKLSYRKLEDIRKSAIDIAKRDPEFLFETFRKFITEEFLIYSYLEKRKLNIKNAVFEFENYIESWKSYLDKYGSIYSVILTGRSTEIIDLYCISGNYYKALKFIQQFESNPNQTKYLYDFSCQYFCIKVYYYIKCNNYSSAICFLDKYIEIYNLQYNTNALNIDKNLVFFKTFRYILSLNSINFAEACELWESLFIRTKKPIYLENLNLLKSFDNTKDSPLVFIRNMLNL